MRATRSSRRFVNDGEDPVDIYWRVLKLETLEAGKETAFETTAGSRWSFRQGDDVLKSVRVGQAARNVYRRCKSQSFDAHPVEMTFVTPSAARVVFDVGEGEVEYEGDRAHPVETYHGPSGAPTMRWVTCRGRLLQTRPAPAAVSHELMARSVHVHSRLVALHALLGRKRARLPARCAPIGCVRFGARAGPRRLAELSTSSSICSSICSSRCSGTAARSAYRVQCPSSCRKSSSAPARRTTAFLKTRPSYGQPQTARSSTCNHQQRSWHSAPPRPGTTKCAPVPSPRPCGSGSGGGRSDSPKNWSAEDVRLVDEGNGTTFPTSGFQQGGVAGAMSPSSVSKSTGVSFSVRPSIPTRGPRSRRPSSRSTMNDAEANWPAPLVSTRAWCRTWS